MTLDLLVGEAQIFLLIFIRIFVFIQIAPLLNSSAVPQIGKIGISFFTSFAILPIIIEANVYTIPDTGLSFAFLLLGEGLIGAIMAFLVDIIMAVFQLAGQFFSTQMGFASSQVFDPLAQIQIPLIGQFLNLVATLIFLTVGGLQKLFLIGISQSFRSVTVSKFVENQENVFPMLITTMAQLFGQALIIAIPIMGVLLLMQITMGLLAKAAPQMNLLMLSFPLNILMAFLVIVAVMPLMIQTFENIFDNAFYSLNNLIGAMSGGQN